MISLGNYARLAIVAVVACLMPRGVGSVQSKSIPQKLIDASYAWRPSQEATHALKKALSNENGTKGVLLKIMQGDHASKASQAFATSFSREAAYLKAIGPPDPGGFTVGEVSYPFRKIATRTYVILNGRPNTIDVTDPKYLNDISISLSIAFKELWDPSIQPQCVWSEPQGYNLQPGKYRDTQSNDVEVRYPIKNLQNGRIIGFAYVVFQFGGRDWGFSDTQLEMITDAADKYLYPK